MFSDQELLIQLVHTKMPFGKYKNQYLVDLPEPYLVWFKNQGFPKGKLGEQLQLILEIKSNGLEELLYKIKRENPKNNEKE